MRCYKFIFYATVLMCTLVAVASAVTPVYCPGNPKCSDINCTSQSCIGDGCLGESFKLDSGPWGGNHNIPNTTCYININMVNETHFTFTSTVAVNAVIVKGGPCANVYFYNPATYYDTDLLSTPGNPHSNKYYDISHIEFCHEKCDNIPVPGFPPIVFGLVLMGSLFVAMIFIGKKFLK